MNLHTQVGVRSEALPWLTPEGPYRNTAQMLSDISSLKIDIVAGLSVDMGTFIYPITFTLRDLVHKTLGKRNTSILNITAEMVSKLVDTEIYHLFIKRITTGYQWARVLVSNTFSVPVDNIIFAIGAFAFTLPWAVVWEIFIFNLLVKYGITLLSLPLIYLAPDRAVEP